MTVVLFNKKWNDEDKKYIALKNVDYYIHNKHMIEIYFLNGTKASLSTTEVKLIDVTIE